MTHDTGQAPFWCSNTRTRWLESGTATRNERHYPLEQLDSASTPASYIAEHRTTPASYIDRRRLLMLAGWPTSCSRFQLSKWDLSTGELSHAWTRRGEWLDERLCSSVRQWWRPSWEPMSESLRKMGSVDKIEQYIVCSDWKTLITRKCLQRLQVENVKLHQVWQWCVQSFSAHTSSMKEVYGKLRVSLIFGNWVQPRCCYGTTSTDGTIFQVQTYAFCKRHRKSTDYNEVTLDSLESIEFTWFVSRQQSDDFSLIVHAH